jgi:hypothetical protein
MSDRITIDHINNNIIIKVKSITLTNMENHSILEWIKTFIHNLESANLQSELPGDNFSSIKCHNDKNSNEYITII